MTCEPPYEAVYQGLINCQIGMFIGFRGYSCFSNSSWSIFLQESLVISINRSDYGTLGLVLESEAKTHPKGAL